MAVTEEAKDRAKDKAPARPSPAVSGGLAALPRSAGLDLPTSIWMYQGGSHLLCPVSGGRAPDAAGRRGGGST